jgi:hypothetical protein
LQEQEADPKPVLAEKTNWWRARRWQYVALAASLIGIVAVAGRLWSWQQGRTLRDEQRTVREQLANLKVENQQLRQRQDQASREIAQLSERVKEMTSPQLNIPVLDVFSSLLTRDAAQPRVTDLRIPPDAKEVALILNPDPQNKTNYQKYSIELVDAQQRVIWSTQGLVRQPGTIKLPTQLLPPGRVTINIYGISEGKSVKVESYQIRLNKPR